MARKIHHLVPIRIGMNKIAEGEEDLDYLNETLVRVAKPLSASLGVFRRDEMACFEHSETSTSDR